jgi:putative transcriptional regulator
MWRLFSTKPKPDPPPLPIFVNLDVMLARRKMRLNALAERVGITAQNLSVLKTGRARAIRFGTLEKLCDVLDCQPGDLFAFEKPTANPAADESLPGERKMRRVER